MSAATVRLHEMLIRHCKGLIRAWEEWLRAQIEAINRPGD